MSEIRDAAELVLPGGWSVDLHPSWPTDAELSPLRWVETSAGPLAEHSHLVIQSDEIEGTLMLCWEVEEGAERIRLRQVLFTGSASRDDLWSALEKVTKLRPMEWWRRWTVNYMVTLMWRISLVKQDQSGDGLARRAQGEVTIRWSDEDRRRLEERLEAGTSMASTPRRDRISTELLTEVAEVYRLAHQNGRRPTQAVAAHFGKPRSTAGRWVSLARQAGFLRPADGPRAGEVAEEDLDG